jgi:hypothetical protein
MIFDLCKVVISAEDDNRYLLTDLHPMKESFRSLRKARARCHQRASRSEESAPPKFRFKHAVCNIAAETVVGKNQCGAVMAGRNFNHAPLSEAEL